MTTLTRIARNPVALALVATLAITGCSSKRSMPNNPGELGLAGNAAPGSRQDFTLNVGDRIFFNTDSSAIRPDAAATLNKQAQWLQKYPNVSVTIEGHADERGTREYNLALGERRANAAKTYLVNLGVDSSRLRTVSYGKERPAVLGSTESAWAQNRRAVTVVE